VTAKVYAPRLLRDDPFLQDMAKKGLIKEVQVRLSAAWPYVAVQAMLYYALLCVTNLFLTCLPELVCRKAWTRTCLC